MVLVHDFKVKSVKQTRKSRDILKSHRNFTSDKDSISDEKKMDYLREVVGSLW